VHAYGFNPSACCHCSLHQAMDLCDGSTYILYAATQGAVNHVCGKAIWFDSFSVDVSTDLKSTPIFTNRHRVSHQVQRTVSLNRLLCARY